MKKSTILKHQLEEYPFVTTSDDIYKNLKYYTKEYINKENLLTNQGYVRVWYIIEEDNNNVYFGPARFIEFKNVTAEIIDEIKDKYNNKDNSHRIDKAISIMQHIVKFDDTKDDKYKSLLETRGVKVRKNSTFRIIRNH